MFCANGIVPNLVMCCICLSAGWLNQMPSSKISRVSTEFNSIISIQTRHVGNAHKTKAHFYILQFVTFFVWSPATKNLPNAAQFQSFQAAWKVHLLQALLEILRIESMESWSHGGQVTHEWCSQRDPDSTPKLNASRPFGNLRCTKNDSKRLKNIVSMSVRWRPRLCWSNLVELWRQNWTIRVSLHFSPKLSFFDPPHSSFLIYLDHFQV